VKKQQNSHKIISLPLSNKAGEIGRDDNDQGLVTPLKSTTPGICTPTQLLMRSRSRRQAMEVSREKCGLRGDKIRALKEKIEAGDYRVEPRAVAEKLVKHLICVRARGILPSNTSRCHALRYCTRARLGPLARSSAD
jgi:hypothetical protein